jgi:hypothetical protein
MLLAVSVLSTGSADLGAQATSVGASPQREMAPTTHTVKRGDTLWDLAARYLGNPFRWPELYRRNTSLIQDPDLIEPGWTLEIGGDPLPAGGAGQAPGEDVKATAGAGAEQGGGRVMPDVTPSPESGSAAASLWAARRRAAERVPYLADLGGVEGAGRIVATPTRNGSPMVATVPGLVQRFDRVRLVLPEGSRVAPGMSLLTLRYGPTLKGIGRVAIPTGILRVLSDSAGGTAELVTQFDQVATDQVVVPAWTTPAMKDSMPTPVGGGPSTAVLWIAGDALLPAPGAAILLSRGSGEGLRVGDQVTLAKQVRPSRRRAPMPEPVPIAVAQVVRVTRAGASAVLLSEVRGAIAVGMTGYVTARLP